MRYRWALAGATVALIAAGTVAVPKPDGRRVLYYRNPMGLPDTSPTPKTDPMGMAYIPVYADQAKTGTLTPGTVQINPGRLQTLGVRTEPVMLGVMPASPVRAAAILRVDERRLATVTTRVPGWIEHLDVAATGDAVQQGEALAELYAPDLSAAEGEYLAAARLGGAIGVASIDRLQALGAPQTEIARLRRTGRSAQLIPIIAPANGVVMDKQVQQGMWVAAGQTLYQTADLSRLWLIAAVQERDLGRVAVGAPATITFVAFPGRQVTARVDFIYPTMTGPSRTAQIRIVLANPDGALRPGMYATVEIGAVAGGNDVLSVPASAVLDDGTRQMVLVAKGGGRFEPRRVQIGAHGNGRDAVRAGLAAGEHVVVDANFLIDAESNLDAASQGFASGAQPMPMGKTP